MRQSEMKTSVEMRRRMTSLDEQDRGGLREPYQDVYSITLNYFGHDVGYVHDPMHAAFSRFHSSLLRSFDLEDKGTSSFSSQSEMEFGRRTTNEPEWNPVPGFETASDSSALVKELDALLAIVVWVSDNVDKPENPCRQSHWKVHNAMVWIGEFAVAFWFAITFR
ncbi:hypothetical protein PBRA_004191 [Plasmodiophora brassicae]|uniref:Uncharacterized protein n=1 Tax=Plasmodiophora brassicae TaxID=37360 RepID=A0A0G4IK31_PLABS|nr:hypothetical protein PBRA_004191 [Plasmodiophora brassicae]